MELLRSPARCGGVSADPGTDRTSRAPRLGRSVELMDNRTEIRDFLTTRRAKITPEQAGLRVYGGSRLLL